MSATKKRTSEVLCEAAGELAARGLAKHWYSEGGRVCAIGALSIATNGIPNTQGEGTPAYYALQAQVRPLAIHEWNDRPERTDDEVIETMLAAASEAYANGD